MSGIKSYWDRFLVLQSESNECGLACIAMIAGYFKKRVDLVSIRKLYNTTNHGMTLKDIINTFDKIDMTARASRVEINDLFLLKQPAIIHWSFNHFVIIIKTTKKYAIIHDPSMGIRRVSLNELSNKFTGIIIEAWPTELFNTRPLKMDLTVLELFRGVRGIGPIIVGVLLISVIIELLSITVPIASQFTIDTLVKASDRDGIVIVGIIIIFALLIRGMLSVIRALILMSLRYILGIKWSEAFFNRLINLTLPFFEKRHIGDITSRFQSLSAIKETFTADMISSILDIIVIFISLLMLLSYSCFLSIGPVLASVIYILLRFFLFSVYKNSKVENIYFDAIQSSHFIETVRAISVVKMLNLTQIRRNEWVNHLINSTHAGNKLFKLDLLVNTISVFLIGLSSIYVLVFGALKLDNDITIGVLLATILYSDIIITRIIKLVNAISDFYLVSMHSQRLTDVILSPMEKLNNNKYSLSLNGGVVIKNLSFRYSENEPYLFENINFEIHSGESIAIIGPSGCGKSTLLYILSGLYTPDSGEIIINGNSLYHIDNNMLREHVAFVMQDDKLLSGSLQKNITGFADVANIDKMIECAKLASIHEEICSFPRGYDTMIGDIGSTLSGGQRQRVSIARALYREPKILLMDEATSDLDVKNEQRITEAINSLKITRIFVAHRPEMIKSADRVFDLQLNSWVS
ncbi:peptidase domain-containing ABC transporter [Providencia manganoxydans]|uniref:peptidase domain-containing ABC transporter n=1 Tax=Providencia manganoxydans TaxID=2923283 RepID=UPI0034E44D9A